MGVVLSPIALAGLRTPKAAFLSIGDVEEYRRYRCPECGETHRRESSAEECCPPQVDMVYQAPDGTICEDENELAEHVGLAVHETNPHQCPVCGENSGDSYEAASCCLWRDIGPSARWRIAAAVEYRGMAWRDAIGQEAAVG